MRKLYSIFTKHECPGWYLEQPYIRALVYKRMKSICDFWTKWFNPWKKMFNIKINNNYYYYFFQYDHAPSYYKWRVRDYFYQKLSDIRGLFKKFWISAGYVYSIFDFLWHYVGTHIHHLRRQVRPFWMFS